MSDEELKSTSAPSLDSSERIPKHTHSVAITDKKMLSSSAPHLTPVHRLSDESWEDTINESDGGSWDPPNYYKNRIIVTVHSVKTEKHHTQPSYVAVIYKVPGQDDAPQLYDTTSEHGTDDKLFDFKDQKFILYPMKNRDDDSIELKFKTSNLGGVYMVGIKTFPLSELVKDKPVSGEFKLHKSHRNDEVVGTIKVKIVMTSTLYSPQPPPIKRALCCAGGGANGAWEVGVMQALMEFRDAKKNEWDMIAGISVGAVTCAHMGQYNVGQEKEAVDSLVEFWKDLKTADVYKKRDPLTILQSPSIFNTAPLRKLLDTHVDLGKLQNSNREVVVGAVSLNNKMYMRIHGKDPQFISGVMGSSAEPVALPPQKIRVRKLESGQVSPDVNSELINHFTDGGVAHVTPFGEAFAYGATHIDAIIPIFENFPDTHLSASPGLLEANMIVIDAMNRNGLLTDLRTARLTAQVRKDVTLNVIRPSKPLLGPDEVMFFTPENISKLMKIGYEDGKNWCRHQTPYVSPGQKPTPISVASDTSPVKLSKSLDSTLPPAATGRKRKNIVMTAATPSGVKMVPVKDIEENESEEVGAGQAEKIDAKKGKESMKESDKKSTPKAQGEENPKEKDVNEKGAEKKKKPTKKTHHGEKAHHGEKTAEEVKKSELRKSRRAADKKKRHSVEVEEASPKEGAEKTQEWKKRKSVGAEESTPKKHADKKDEKKKLRNSKKAHRSSSTSTKKKSTAK